MGMSGHALRSSGIDLGLRIGRSWVRPAEGHNQTNDQNGPTNTPKPRKHRWLGVEAAEGLGGTRPM